MKSRSGANGVGIRAWRKTIVLSVSRAEIQVRRMQLLVTPSEKVRPGPALGTIYEVGTGPQF